MDKNTEKVLQNLKNKKVGVFCDDSNLYHAYRKYGWRVDLKKFRELIGGYCDLQFINYYLVVPAANDIIRRHTEKFIGRINSAVNIKRKELKYTPVGGQVVKKGNMDVEIVLDIVRKIEGLDVIIVVSGDSDFLELKNYVVFEKKKNILFMGYKENMAWELKLCWHLYINRIRNEIELK